MNTQSLTFRSMLGVILFVFCFIKPSCKAEEQNVTTFSNQVATLEAIWTANKIDEYHEQVTKMIKSLTKEPADSNSINILANLLNSISKKEYSTKISGVGFLSDMESLSLHIAQYDKMPNVESQSNMTFVAEYLGHIRGERIRNFQPLLVVANVSPPAGVPGFSGMNPDAISDPMTKSNYLKAIQRNQENNFLNQRQMLLSKIDKKVSRPIIEYMIRTIQNNAVPSTLIAKWMDIAKLDDTEEKEIRDKTISKNEATNGVTKSTP